MKEKSHKRLINQINDAGMYKNYIVTYSNFAYYIWCIQHKISMHFGLYNVISYLFDPRYLVYKCSMYPIKINIGYASDFISMENSNYKQTIKKYIKRSIMTRIIGDKNEILLKHSNNIGTHVGNMIDYWFLCQNINFSTVFPDYEGSSINLDDDIIKRELKSINIYFSVVIIQILLNV